MVYFRITSYIYIQLKGEANIDLFIYPFDLWNIHTVYILSAGGFWKQHLNTSMTIMTFKLVFLSQCLIDEDLIPTASKLVDDLPQ